MLLLWIAFIFVAFVSKFFLAVAMCYLIFPAERTCDECDTETLAVRMGPLGRGMSRMMMGNLQRRWCPGCGWEGMTRTSARGSALHLPRSGDPTSPARR
ncbi:MAG TPA: hypothetical protein VF665_04120 [Longimicrobium sp.]|jgi:hypothetical protein|uniref:hypothetical protein n=1 Tax=Longimicrobium sp. TaxID=2029185 RepID=UPI002EDB9B63